MKTQISNEYALFLHSKGRKLLQNCLDYIYKKDYDSLPEREKEFYSDFNEFMYDYGNWWLDQDSDENLKMVIERFRLTIGVCLYSSTYDEDSLKEEIDSNWDYEK